MKRMIVTLAACAMLCGCAAQDTFETLGDVDMAPAVQQQKTVRIAIPEHTQKLQGQSGTMYLCNGFEVAVEVAVSGDLNATFRMLTGFGLDDLTVISTASSELSRYECAWSSAAEGGDLVGRVMVLDDGLYHYCISLTAGEDNAAGINTVWKQITDSVVLE